ncbi:MAG: hypothetical protein UR85_C0003G0014 [Candidatus Nomurabacteria bacterium GW2011_GWF2_35_66]|uniref:SHS2 domain-containing protein n=1 Tax=Candidatus Nomurabacteria bacterium GW2011_GWE1_35_16 TaxID=1618761 RepID=A0A0G0B8P4_9BACT|nr:MAG: hypothetical protein UR55_C0005G0014 [Candidatus Nomurabacteria bacterium GW2011_GWF1_34_20]KKP63342.1 MAG: hypothetical protein UR57_C0005G0014 [Candidatus Nomurabacteria bacterium GW2011_GWE2_34_25]KKP65743.1 MAG: hypothetical protein UR64_C0019G0007 [Candidatus Nomurabacteria bacterium GW2011_GWE1_35_16]KKP83579.1 MAG: hypothetical protein UR85_C0003G0014 [Candidatus Nomurabacteria bacterium GW2011_GWF2_35_66]HAE36840.1 hypothetical protein [Candidatus Nomurabacteria bacterium]
MDFSFSSKKEKMVAIFDIGSGSVGGAFVTIPSDRNKLPTIIKSTRVDIVEREELDFNVFLKDMILALGFASRNLYQSKLGAPDEIVCVLASPWYISETRLIKISKEHSFIFTKKVVDELLAKELSSLDSIYKNKYGEAESAPEVIEHPIVGISLNGYQVDDPLGKRTRSIEMNMVISLSPKICLDSIKETISKSFHHTPISFSSFMVASFISVRDKYMNHDSYLLLDIGGEVTDVGIVAKGVLKESLSFPYGKKTLFRDICKSLKVELRDAYELFSLFNKGTLSEKEIKKLKPVLDFVELAWGKSFRECINSLPRTLTLPNVMFLTIDSDVKDWFVKVINSEEYIQSMVPNKKFTLVAIDGPEFLNMCNVKNGTCDPFLMIESINVMRKVELYE